MNYSKHNIFSKIRDSENYFIVNPLTGNADILDADDAEKLEILRNGGEVADKVFIAELTEKGYLADEAAENRLYRSRYLDFIDARDKDEIQIFLLPITAVILPALTVIRTSIIIPERSLIMRLLILFSGISGRNLQVAINTLRYSEASPFSVAQNRRSL